VKHLSYTKDSWHGILVLIESSGLAQ